MVAPFLYLLVGKEEFLKKEFIRNLKSSLFKHPSEQDLNFQIFDAASGGFSAFRDFLQTLPFLSARRLAVLSAVEELAEREKEGLLSLAGSWPPSAVAVLDSGETNTRKNPFLTALSERAKTVPCHAPFDRDLPQWLLARAKAAGVRLEPSAAPLLLEKIGKDTAALSSAVETLAAYVHPRKDACARDVEALFGRSLQKDVFGLVDVLVKKDAKAALSMTARFLREGTRGFEIVAVLAGQFDRMHKACALMAEGLPAARVGAELKVPPFFLDKFLAQAKSVSRFELKRVFQQLLLCDESIKTGVLSEGLAVERLVLSLCLE